MPHPAADPLTRNQDERFNPLDPTEIGRVLQERLDKEEFQPFPPERFNGSGLYAIYAAQQLDLYAGLQGTNIPIYVGKAEAGNSSYGFAPDYSAPKLWNRIVKHAGSVGEVTGEGAHRLTTTDLRVRYLKLDDAWIVLGERALLRQYGPVLWNTLMNGFGSNPPGSARKNARSAWDTVHPGRQRAGQLPNRYFTLAELEQQVRRGVEISLMEDAETKLHAVEALRTRRPAKMWSPAAAGRDSRIVVHDAHRFLDEVERMGLTIASTDFRIAEAPLRDERDERDDDSEALAG